MSFPKFCDTSRYSGVFGNAGPKTPQGRAIAARNATTHGLFARDVVLPSLGEDPKGYETLYHSLCQQLEPGNLIDHHYVEAIAAAFWRLRRLHRWQAQVHEDEALTEDERLDKLDRVLRHETALHRQIDKSVRLLGRDVPTLFEGRARKEALAHLGQTERGCRADLNAAQDVADRAHDNMQFLMQFLSLPAAYDRTRFDNLCPAPDAPSSDAAVSDAAVSDAAVSDAAVSDAAVSEAPTYESSSAEGPAGVEKCQNELPSVPVKTTKKPGKKKSYGKKRRCGSRMRPGKPHTRSIQGRRQAD